MKTLYLLLVFLFFNSLNAQWVQQGSDLDGQFSNEAIGNAVDMPDSLTLAVGAKSSSLVNGSQSGRVSVYRWSGSSWSLKGNPLIGSAPLDNFGTSLSMPDSNTLAVGAPNFDANSNANSGLVKVFVWNGSAWNQKGNDLNGIAASDRFGTSVSMPDSNTLAVGTPYSAAKGSLTGQVRVFNWDGNAWVQKGDTINGDTLQVWFGADVSMPDSNTLAVGSPYYDGNNISNNGQVKIYKWQRNAWVQMGNDIYGEATNNFSGEAISMPDSNTIGIGAAQNDDNGSSSGHARIYQWNGTNWVQKGADLDGEAAGDYFGRALSMPDSNTIAIGALFNQGNGIDAGHVRVFAWDGTSWVQRGMDLDSEAAGDRFGESVSMANSLTLAAGATANDGSFTNAGHVRVFRDTSITTGITSNSLNKRQRKIYPNPAGNYFFFEVDQIGENDELIVFDMQGRKVLRRTIDQSREKIEIEGWDAGIYFVRYGDSIKKLVITK